VQLAGKAERLRAAGIEALAIVISPIERARLYFKHRPVGIPVLADPDLVVHRAFGLPRFELMDGKAATARWPLALTRQEFLAARSDAMGESPAPLSFVEAGALLNERDGYELTEVDEQVRAKHWTQLAGHFLIDRAGIIRWTHVEAERGIGDFGKFPGDEEILTAARTLSSG
jgi:AhpC/TSA antioxidant enzyme